MYRKIITICFLLVGSALTAQTINNEYTLMYDAIVSNDLETLSSLLEQCEDINNVEFDGHHIFESIFIMENCEAAELLLEYGLDLNYKNIDGSTLKTLILRSNNKKLISFIAKYKNN